MKRIATIVAALLLGITAFADDYTPTTTWPYIYEDFIPGEIVTTAGGKKSLKINISLAKANVHFIDGDMISELSNFDIASVKIGSDTYVNAAGKLMKVLAENENGYVVEGYDVDFAKLNSTGGAYGSSSNTLGTMNLSSLEVIGASSTGQGGSVNHMELKANKEAGQTLPLISRKYIFAAKKTILANKGEIGDLVGKDKLKTFLKANKVKWNDAWSLLQIVDLVSAQE